MLAAWYEQRGPARTVLRVGELPDPAPGAGEVRVKISRSGINPGDVKKRAARAGPMPYPLVIPHSDGSGIIDEVGHGIPETRIGQRVWCYGAQSYRPFGTAAEYTVVPDTQAVALPGPPAGTTDDELLDQAASLGIAGITAHRAIHAQDPISGLTILVHGATGGVGSIAVQLAVHHRARVIATVREPRHLDTALALGAHHAFLTGDPTTAEQIRALAPDGVHRIAEVDLAANIDLDAAVLAVGGTVSSYYSSEPRPSIPYWQLGFADVTLHLLGSDDFPPSAKESAAGDLTEAFAAGAVRPTVVARFPLTEIAEAHDLVERGAGGRVVLTITDPPARQVGSPS